ncbi:QueT transporter family protein [Aerococcaceae bacterium DSM 111176]|nr:QueT transporter family protein [Aerococcaceae bacterium DSM 111176]
MKTSAYNNSTAKEVVLTAIIAALYIVLTLVLAPLSFGIGLRISEGLNLLALYNKRHIWGVTIGVFFVNYFAYGAIDMVVGSLSTLVFLFLGRWIADKAVDQITKRHTLKIDPMIIKYIILTIVFSLSMFTIALMVLFLDASAAFWPTYISMVFIELLSMGVGGFIVYPLSKRIDLTK